MGLFSFFRKNQQESSVGNSDFYSQADEEKPAGRRRRQVNQRDEPVDPVLPEKKRARRRLIGAIALVLAAIIGLPMILDSEPKPLADDINIQIPSKDTVTPVVPSKPAAAVQPAQDVQPQSGTLGLGPDEEVVSPATAVAAGAASHKTDAPVADAEKVEVDKKVTEHDTKKAEPDVKKADAGKKPSAVVAKAASPEPKAATSSSAVSKKQDDAARARAILEGKPVAAASDNAAADTPASGKVVLQVAALASQDKVDELQKKLQAAGLKSYTQKVATQAGERIRVRVGPFDNAAEAEKVRAKLVKLGLSGKVLPV